MNRSLVCGMNIRCFESRDTASCGSVREQYISGDGDGVAYCICIANSRTHNVLREYNYGSVGLSREEGCGTTRLYHC
jgi:hypothetical protein